MAVACMEMNAGAEQLSQSCPIGLTAKELKAVKDKEKGKEKDKVFNCGEYLLGRKIGRGAFGVVRLAKHRKTELLAAGKIFAKQALKPIDIEDARREVEFGRVLSHPNLIGFYDVFENEKYYVIIQEFASGGDLHDRVPEGKGIPEAEVHGMFVDIMKGVMHCHNRMVAHLDIKPKNILIGGDGRLKLCDFGLSERQDKADRAPVTHGSLRFAAPEIFEGTALNGYAVDMWACGVTLQFMLTGDTPFWHKSWDELGSPRVVPTDGQDSPAPSPACSPAKSPVADAAAEKAQREKEKAKRKRAVMRELRAALKKGEFDIPASVSPDAADLIRKLLQRNPEDRPMAGEVLIHPWMTACPAKESRPFSRAATDTVLEKMDKFTDKVINILKWRPGRGRPPTSAEVAAQKRAAFSRAKTF
eukprot:TRINITY_DN9766_c0_g2_i1.p1 TRINITY_DN9766_c0_g2~~TRINITY_DN9766_c0_g2_i1.p1  ORF type:complete len:416 (+),score=178.70 TRINITY_DN9766_c0_g2_i1:89-1336(+)